MIKINQKVLSNQNNQGSMDKILKQMDKQMTTLQSAERNVKMCKDREEMLLQRGLLDTNIEHRIRMVLHTHNNAIERMRCIVKCFPKCTNTTDLMGLKHELEMHLNSLYNIPGKPHFDAQVRPVYYWVRDEKRLRHWEPEVYNEWLQYFEGSYKCVYDYDGKTSHIDIPKTILESTLWKNRFGITFDSFINC